MSETKCCPKCNGTDYKIRSRKGGYRCLSCQETIQQLKSRETSSKCHNPRKARNGSLAKKLEEMNPDDL